MSYATPDNVKSLFRDFAPNSQAAVSDTELQEFLDDASAVIDAKIGTLYSMPIAELDSPESWKILRRLESYKVACIVDDILNNYSESDKKPMWCQRASELMDQLVPPMINCRQCPPTMKLPDATYLGTGTQRGRITLSSTEGTVFRKNEDNW